MTSRFSHRIATTALLAVMALPVLAQQPPAAALAAPAKAPEGRHEQHGHPGHPPADMAQRYAQHHAQRLAELKAQLQLTPAQEPAWTTFTSALQPGERPARLDAQGMDKLTTPERIDRMRALRAQHAAEADRRGEATKAFYATLTPEQQKVFDAKTQHRGPHRGPMGGGESRHGHGDHHGSMHGGEGRPAPAPAR